VISGVLPSGWTLTQINDVSDDGVTFTGIGLHNGVTEGWVATIPAPGIAPTIVAFLLVGRRRR